MEKIISYLTSKDLIIKFTKFAIVGAIGTFINLGVLFLFADIFGVYYIISEVIAFYVSVLNNYILNKVWTFKEKIKERTLIKYLQYLIINILSLIINLGVLYILVEAFNVWYILAEFFAIICAFLVNFIGNTLWTFRKREEENSDIIMFIKTNLYLILPILSAFLWALFNLINQNFIATDYCDFAVFYDAGKLLYNQPLMLYDPIYRYFHMPAFASFCAITISLLPYPIAYYSFYAVNLVLISYFILQFNEILTLTGVGKKWYRFIFLIIISNGFIVLGLFYQNSFKLIIGNIILYILLREIKYRRENKQKDLKYFLINYGLFTFAIAIFPPFLLFFLVYIFHDINLKEILKFENIKKYLIVVFMFAWQNILFFIYPSYILDFLNSFQGHNIHERGYFPLFYFREWIELESYDLIFLISAIYMVIIALILILKRNLSIEKKFAYTSLAWVIFSIYGTRSFFLIVPLTLLLYVPFMQQKSNFKDFIKNNYVVILGLISVGFVYLMPPNYTIYKYLPFLQEFPLIVLVNLRYLILLLIFCASLGYLYYTNIKKRT
ncbi:MAG: GtrA family protein [Candidatus Heimdallarchaeota archaeon]